MPPGAAICDLPDGHTHGARQFSHACQARLEILAISPSDRAEREFMALQLESIQIVPGILKIALCMAITAA